MKDLGITKGEWNVDNESILSGNYGWSLEIKCDGYTLCANDMIQVWADSNDELVSNSKLIADAGNTAQKCGLLPSELLEQRNELFNALQNCYDSLMIYGKHPLIQKQVEKIIKKATS